MLYMISVSQSRDDASTFDINVCRCYSSSFNLEALAGAYQQVSVSTIFTSRTFSISEINNYWPPKINISYEHDGFGYKLVYLASLVTESHLNNYLLQLQSDLILVYTESMRKLFPRMYYCNPQTNILRY